MIKIQKTESGLRQIHRGQRVDYDKHTEDIEWTMIKTQKTESELR